jgi:uric acid transporter
MSLTNAPEAVPPGAGDRPAVHPVDEVLPAPRLFILGLQHLFIMYAGAVAVPLIVGGALGLPASTIGLLVNADLLVSGIATVIQSVGIGKIFGVRLPVVAGATFTVLTPMIIVAQKYGLPAVYGALLVSGVFGLLIAKSPGTTRRPRTTGRSRTSRWPAWWCCSSWSSPGRSAASSARSRCWHRS